MTTIVPRSQREAGKLLFSGYASSGATSHYLTPTSVSHTDITRIRAVGVHPSNGYSVIRVWVGASATDRYVELASVTLGPGESMEFNGGDGLMALDALQRFWSQADRDDSIALHVHGLEVTR